MSRACLSWLAAGLLAGALPSLHAAPSLPALFSDHMVLQRSDHTPVWGWAKPGEALRVEVAGLTQSVTADDSGAWRASFDLEEAAEGPHTLTVQGESTLTVRDVLVGEVWLCSGQSNMGFIVRGATGGPEEAARTRDPLLREFHVDKVPALQPADRVGGRWSLTEPGKTEFFSAAGYYFGRALRRELGVPVGLIHVSYGGTPIETWMSLEALARNEALGESARRHVQELSAYPGAWKAYVDAFRHWQQANGREDTPPEASPPQAAESLDTSDWQEINLPQTAADVTGDPGAVWLRKEVTIEPRNAGKKWLLYVGVPARFVRAYWNGEQVGRISLDNLRGTGLAYNFDVPARLVREGANTVALRVFNPAGPPALLGTRNELRVSTIASLAGPWRVHRDTTQKPLTQAEKASLPTPPAAVPQAQNVATTLFNGSIHPLIPYGIRGFLWYQGESNSARAWQYRDAFRLLIEDWRQRWQRGDLPFYFCQIANVQGKDTAPGESALGELRESQASVLSLPNTGQAVLLDVGEVEVHYKNKEDVGERLARLALARTYGKAVADSGPVFQSMAVEGDRVRVTFTQTGGGLIARPVPDTYTVRAETGETRPLVRNSPESQLEGFAICGKDRHWHWADAMIEGDTVVVSSPQVSEPVAVRYGWANNPTINLYNAAGLPAAPFRTDDFEATTRNVRY